MENQIEMPSQDFLNELKCDKPYTSRMLDILYDWIYEVAKMFKFQKCFGLAVSIINIYCYLSNNVNTKNLQLVGSASLHLASVFFYDMPGEMADYVYIMSGAFAGEQIQDMIIDIINTLKGVLIRPYGNLFTNDKSMLSIITLSQFIPHLIIYKPSMIVETARYLTTGQYKIYSPNELRPICDQLTSTINSGVKSSLTNLKKFALECQPLVKFTCFKDQAVYKSLTFKYNNAWHIGAHKKEQILGQGTFGKVQKIKSQCGLDMVVKISVEQDNNEVTFNEIAILLNLSNPYIIKLCQFEIQWDKSKLYLPLAQGTLRESVDTKMIKNNFTKYMIQITTGVQACHQHDIIHRDLKPQNIVYHEATDSYLLIDFGLSVPYASFRGNLSPDLAGTLWWKAPEVLLGDSHYTIKIDIWALGVIFYFMVTGQDPFKGMDEEGMLIRIFDSLETPNELTWPGVTSLPDWSQKFNGQYSLPITEKIGKAKLQLILGKYYNIIMSCLTLNPNQRITADELLIMLNQL